MLEIDSNSTLLLLSDLITKVASDNGEFNFAIDLDATILNFNTIAAQETRQGPYPPLYGLQKVEELLEVMMALQRGLELERVLIQSMRNNPRLKAFFTALPTWPVPVNVNIKKMLQEAANSDDLPTAKLEAMQEEIKAALAVRRTLEAAVGIFRAAIDDTTLLIFKWYVLNSRDLAACSTVLSGILDFAKRGSFPMLKEFALHGAAELSQLRDTGKSGGWANLNPVCGKCGKAVLWSSPFLALNCDEHYGCVQCGVEFVLKSDAERGFRTNEVQQEARQNWERNLNLNNDAGETPQYHFLKIYADVLSKLATSM